MTTVEEAIEIVLRAARGYIPATGDDDIGEACDVIEDFFVNQVFND